MVAMLGVTLTTKTQVIVSGKYEDAKKHYIEAIELNKQKHYDYGLISNYIVIALLNASQNNRE